MCVRACARPKYRRLCAYRSNGSLEFANVHCPNELLAQLAVDCGAIGR